MEQDRRHAPDAQALESPAQGVNAAAPEVSVGKHPTASIPPAADLGSLPDAHRIIPPRSFPRGSQGNLSLKGPLGHAPSAELFSASEIRCVHLGPQGCTNIIDGNQSLQSMRVGFGRFPDPADSSRILHLIPQFHWHASGLAVTEMLKLDRGKPANLAGLIFVKIDDGISMESRLRDELIPARFEWRKDVEPLAHLRAMVAAFGSTAVQIAGELGPHFIIVDRFDEAAGVAHIREPYHGWAIAIDIQALQGRLDMNRPGIQCLIVDESDKEMQNVRLNKNFDDYLANHPVIRRVCEASPALRTVGLEIFRRSDKAA